MADNTILPDHSKYRASFIKASTFNNYLDRNKGLDEPTYLGFKILFHFNDQMSPLINSSSDPNDNTALNFLRKCTNSAGELLYPRQINYLKNFITMLQYVSQNSEWYFQKIEGLDQIIGWDFLQSKIRDTKQFTINTLEGLDLRINAILDNYVLACFETNSRTVIIPQNLRYFAMSIYITDLRQFADSFFNDNDELISALNHGLGDSSTRPSLFYRLDLCEFDKTSKGNILQTLDNNQRDPNDNKLVINHFGEVAEYPLYVLNEQIEGDAKEQKPQNVLSSPPVQSLADKAQSRIISDYRAIADRAKDGSDALKDLNDKFGNKTFRIKNALKTEYNSSLLNSVKNKINNALEKTVLNGITDIENKLNGKIAPLLLGNVYSEDTVNVVRRSVGDILNSGLSLF